MAIQILSILLFLYASLFLYSPLYSLLDSVLHSVLVHHVDCDWSRLPRLYVLLAEQSVASVAQQTGPRHLHSLADGCTQCGVRVVLSVVLLPEVVT
jgi:hypothetical protein